MNSSTIDFETSSPEEIYKFFLSLPPDTEKSIIRGLAERIPKDKRISVMNVTLKGILSLLSNMEKSLEETVLSKKNFDTI